MKHDGKEQPQILTATTSLAMQTMEKSDVAKQIRRASAVSNQVELKVKSYHLTAKETPVVETEYQRFTVLI